MPEATEVARPRLWDLADQMRALLDTEEGGVPPEEEQAFGLAVREALLASRDKVDAYHGILGQTLMNATVAEAMAGHHAEQARAMNDRAARLRGVADRIKNYVLDAIRALGVDPKSKTNAYRKLEGTACTFQANRVVPSCEVFDSELIPIKYKSVTISATVTGEQWLTACVFCDGIRRKAPNPSDGVECSACDSSGMAFPASLSRGSFIPAWSINKRALLADLKKPCEPCGGRGLVAVDTDKRALLADLKKPCEVAVDTVRDLQAGPAGGVIHALEPCPACFGKGTLRVPGARLIDGKLSLVVK